MVGARAGAGTPLVSYGLIGLNVLIYLITALSPGGTVADNTGSRLFGRLGAGAGAGRRRP